MFSKPINWRSKEEYFAHIIDSLTSRLICNEERPISIHANFDIADLHNTM